MQKIWPMNTWSRRAPRVHLRGYFCHLFFNHINSFYKRLMWPAPFRLPFTHTHTPVQVYRGQITNKKIAPSGCLYSNSCQPSCKNYTKKVHLVGCSCCLAEYVPPGLSNLFSQRILHKRRLATSCVVHFSEVRQHSKAYVFLGLDSADLILNNLGIEYKTGKKIHK